LRLFLLPKPFRILTDNKAATTFAKQVLDNFPNMRKLHGWQNFFSQFNRIHEHVLGHNNFLTNYLTKEIEYLNHFNSRQIKELEDIIIDFNKYLETVSTGLEQFDT